MCLNRACALLVIGLAVAAGASAQTCFPPPSGLIAWWDGDAVAGGTAIDIVGGFDGSLVGDAATAPGQVGDAFSFDGVGDYVQLPIDSGIFTTGQFTIDAWAFPTKLSQAAYLQGILDNDTTSPLGPRGVTLAVYGGVPPPFQDLQVAGVFHNPDETQYFTGPFPTVANQWHHYALTYDGSQSCLYQDGLQEDCVPASGPVIDNDVNFRIGHGQADTAIQRFFAGRIDEVEIYDRALSASEIQGIFNAGSAGKCKDQDRDGDGVNDDIDVCPGTVIPESVPTRGLRRNRWALEAGDGVFDTNTPPGGGPRPSFTIDETAGCSCEQIIAAQGLGRGHTKFGCSISAMEEWVALVNP